jgi:hypothetical protein
MRKRLDKSPVLDERPTYEELTLPTGEFVVLLGAALLLLGMVFGFVVPTLPSL